MNEICSIKNIEIDKISLLFCSKCKALVGKNSKKCDNLKCSKVFCSECTGSMKCPECQIGKLKNNSISSINLENLLFCCNKSIECKGEYKYEEILKNHSHKNMEIIKCNKCKKNLNQSVNCLKCQKCHKYFCYKRLSYNPLSATKENNIENCGIKCIKCNKQFCSLCSNDQNNRMKCPECSNIINKNENINLNEINKCSICSNNKSWKNCNICNNNICFTCSNICENNSCKNIICINCSLLCNICKKIICQKCSIKCFSCPSNKSLISCINCNSDALIKCSMKNCNKKLCLNCLKYCNYCKEINCKEHSLSCANCSETICPFHWHMCKLCSITDKDYSKNKLCLKNCTKKCQFCNNEINMFCKEENHPDNFIKQYECGHYICNQCIKKCDICKEPIKTCLECEKDNNFVNCRICDKCLCYDCSKKCTICGEHYCAELHKCYLCDKTINNDFCLNCDFNERIKCMICSKNLYQCQKCSKMVICSYNCFSDHIKIKPKVNKNFNRSRTTQSIKSNITNNVINNVANLFQSGENEIVSSNYNKIKGNQIIIETDKGEHICLMYYCEEHLGNDQNAQINIENKNIGELNSRGEDGYNVKKYKRIIDKENVKCSSCEIF